MTGPGPAAGGDAGVPPVPLAGGAGFKIRRLHNLMQAGWSAWFSRFQVALTPMQGGILALVADRPGLSQIALAGLLGIEPPTLSQAIAPLRRLGLLDRRRGPGDRRAYALHLTEKGGATVALLRREVPRHEDRVLKGLSAAERRQLHRLLDKALAAAPGPDGSLAA